MRCLSSSWLDPHQTQLPFTLSGKSSKNAATLPFHCLVHVEQKYGVSQKKSTSHVQKMLPWEMLRKRMPKVVVLPQHLQIRPAAIWHPLHNLQEACKIHTILQRKLIIRRLFILWYWAGLTGWKNMCLESVRCVFFGSTKMISVYIYIYWNGELQIFMEHQGEAPLIQRSCLYIDQGLFIGEFTDLFAKPQVCHFCWAMVSPFFNLLGDAKKMVLNCLEKQKDHAEKTTLTMSDSWFTIVLYPLVSLLKIPDHWTIWMLYPTISDLPCLKNPRNLQDSLPKDPQFWWRFHADFPTISSPFPHHFHRRGTYSDATSWCELQCWQPCGSPGSSSDSVCRNAFILCNIISIYVCLSVCLSVCLPVCLSVWLSVCLSVRPSVCLYVCMHIYIYMYMYIYIWSYLFAN